MRKLSKLILLLALAVLCGAVCSCIAVVPSDDGDPNTHRVMLTVSEGITVTSQNPVEVATGEDATFTVTFENGYVFESISNNATFDTQSNTVTVKGVTAKTSVSLVAKNVGYDTSVVYRFYGYFASVEWDKADPPHDSRVHPGMSITVTAGDTQRVFVGWSFKGHGIDIVSTDRVFTFTVTPELADSRGVIVIYSCYSDGNILYYDANGGEINTETKNYQGNDNATVTDEGDGVLKVTLSKELVEYQTTASAFYNDGTFYREGYVLKEYNTKPDGTGEAYAPGDKVNQIALNGENVTLYCIWEEASADDLWGFSEYTYPDNYKYLGKHGFLSSGIVIQSYAGAEQTVVVPEEIDGIPVIGIDTGAFDGITRMKELILPRTIQFIRDGAFVGCTSLKKLVYPTGIVEASDDIMDAQTKASLKTLFTYHNVAPVYANGEPGSFSVKLSRLMTTQTQNRLIILGGSSVYQGISSRFLEKLFGYEYCIINFGTTRTLTIMLYLDAVDYYTKEGDMVIMSPENHARAMGDTSFVANSYDDAEGMYPSLMRHLDIRNFSGVFSSLSQFNLNRASRGATRYEEICKLGGSDAYGDDISDNTRRSLLRNQSGCIAYTDTYVVTFNERIKSSKDAKWDDASAQEASRDWKDKSNETWCSFNDPIYANQVNRMISEVKATGASFYFAFAPVDGTGVEGSTWGVIPECKADPDNWLAAYDKLITDTYDVDGLIGKSSDYIYHHNYFYDNIYHLNNWGRAIRTYQLYLDLCDVLGIVNKVGATSKGTDFAGCKFESDITNPTYTVDWLK